MQLHVQFFVKVSVQCCRRDGMLGIDNGGFHGLVSKTFGSLLFLFNGGGGGGGVTREAIIFVSEHKLLSFPFSFLTNYSFESKCCILFLK